MNQSDDEPLVPHYVTHEDQELLQNPAYRNHVMNAVNALRRKITDPRLETGLPEYGSFQFHHLSNLVTDAQLRAEGLVHVLFEDHPTSTALCVFGPRNILDQPLYLAAITTSFRGGLSSDMDSRRDAQMRAFHRFLKSSRATPRFRITGLDMKMINTDRPVN